VERESRSGTVRAAKPLKIRRAPAESGKGPDTALPAPAAAGQRALLSDIIE